MIYQGIKNAATFQAEYGKNFYPMILDTGTMEIFVSILDASEKNGEMLELLMRDGFLLLVLDILTKVYYKR